MTSDTWHVTGDTWHVTSNTRQLTGGGRWIFSQNFCSPALMVWEWRFDEDICTNHYQTNQLINYKVVFKTALATQVLLNTLSFTINMRQKGFIKSLPCRGLVLPFYELMKLGVLAKWKLKLPKNQNRYIFDLDHVRYFLGIFFILFNGELITPAFRIDLHFCPKTTPKKPQT